MHSIAITKQYHNNVILKKSLTNDELYKTLKITKIQLQNCSLPFSTIFTINRLIRASYDTTLWRN